MVGYAFRRDELMASRGLWPRQRPVYAAVFVSVSAAHQGPGGGGPVAAIVDLD